MKRLSFKVAVQVSRRTGSLEKTLNPLVMILCVSRRTGSLEKKLNSLIMILCVSRRTGSLGFSLVSLLVRWVLLALKAYWVGIEWVIMTK